MTGCVNLKIQSIKKRLFVSATSCQVIAGSLFWIAAMATIAFAQSGAVEARVANLKGQATFSRGTTGIQFKLKKGERIQPGDVIDTSLGGQVVLSLSDGSLVTIHPNARVVLKDFRHANSARELLDILFGRVRFKIHHYGNRPNPYRVNSPAASIAVRGTEFLVSTDASGETLVFVFEGAVEVVSHANPRRRKLLESGHSVIVRPGGDMSMASSGPGSELNSVARLDFGRPDPLNEIVSSLQVQYFDNLSHVNAQPLPTRYAAFADSYFDSLDNPAYATEFRHSEGRLYWLPSFSRSRQLVRIGNSARIEPVHPFDNTLSSHVSFFAPIAQTRFVFGGAASVARTELQGMKAASFLLGSSPDLYVERDSAAMTTKTVSLLLARSLDSRARTSVGLKFDYLQGRGTASVEDSKTRRGFTEVFRLDMQAVVDRVRLTAGLTHDFDGGGKLGLLFRAGNTPSGYSELQQSGDSATNRLAGFQLGRERHSGRTAELGVKWRAPITRRLFYGVEGLLSVERWAANSSVLSLSTHRTSASAFEGNTLRGIVGGGLGFALKKHSFLNVDLTGGRYREQGRSRNLTRETAGIHSEQSHFLALHVAGQTHLWRGSFLSGSVLRSTLWESRTATSLFPAGGSTEFISPGLTRYFSSFGAGWRVRPNLFAQYLFSTSYGSAPFSHSLMFRYAFDFSGER